MFVSRRSMVRLPTQLHERTTLASLRISSRCEVLSAKVAIAKTIGRRGHFIRARRDVVLQVLELGVTKDVLMLNSGHELGLDKANLGWLHPLRDRREVAMRFATR